MVQVKIKKAGAAVPHESEANTLSTALDPIVSDASSYWTVAVCNGCDMPVAEVRHKCQECPDFDYCNACVGEASLTHPSHTFTEMAVEPLLVRRASSKVQFTISDDTSDGEQYAPLGKLDEVLGISPSSFSYCRCCYKAMQYTLPLAPWLTRLTPKENRITIPWAVTISKLVEATQRGCQFCAFLLSNLFSNFGGIVRAILYKPAEDPWYTSPSENNDQQRELIQTWMERLATYGNKPFQIIIEPEYGVDEYDLCSMWIGIGPGEEEGDAPQFDPEETLRELGAPHPLRIRVFAASGTHASEHVTSCPPNPSPKSSASMQQIREWLGSCEEDHPLCRGAKSVTALPTRLLDISSRSGEGSQIRLYEPSENEQGRYATLSYCWGGPQENQTTTQNLPARLSGLRPEILPQTLQDAIYMAKELGIDFLWIDSICIVQDDEVEKQTQIDQMGYIYQNSVITICAARDYDINKGFFEDWSSPKTGLWPGMVPIPYPVFDKTAVSVQEATELPAKLGTIWLAREEDSVAQSLIDPLTRRGWCLQERILSPRIIEFGRWPVWRCLAGSQHHGALTEDTDELKSQHYTKILMPRTENGLGLDFFSTAQLYDGWYKIVERYCRTKLGDESDRLPAIGGVASRISSVTGIEYMAGLWKNNLLHDIMWTCDPGEWERRAKPWRAPTWSWASVQGPVLYDSLTSDAQPLAQVLHCEVKPRVGAEMGFGQVVGGSLSVRGPFSEVDRDIITSIMQSQNLAPAPPSNNSLFEWDKILTAFHRNRPETESDPETLPNDTLSVLLTFERDWKIYYENKVDEECWAGLFLRDAGDGKYERIGAFAFYPAKHFREKDIEWEDRTIVLV